MAVAKPQLPLCIRRFVADESGVALVEFAVVLPLTLLIFGFVVEGSRMMLSYQEAIAGVRDATRYVARTMSASVCSAGTTATYPAGLLTLARQGTTGASVFPTAVTIDSVTPSYACSPTGTYRIGTKLTLVQVDAQLTITFPFAAIFTLVGISRPSLTTHVVDKARVQGS